MLFSCWFVPGVHGEIERIGWKSGPGAGNSETSLEKSTERGKPYCQKVKRRALPWKADPENGKSQLARGNRANGWKSGPGAENSGAARDPEY
ncbi:hypothetical protein ACE4RR_20455 [Alteribacillus sp. HJP-4]